MNPFVVSARKYRPATFDTVVGQGHITNTLKNAIRNNHLAQAFLFCGPRGVGKTTCARILAKTLNCSNITENTEACNECTSCVSFNSGQSLNIYELDAASNNSVDDIRSLVEQVRYAPHSGEFKIYIIDEVHMLSSGAFNAFLKTLEEPPPYAIFILATTEKHKIIPTILSRCQIFDFNRIQIEDISNHLQYVAKNENITADPDALHIIAQKADGALRDALSIFDQIVSFAGSNISYKDVITNLSMLDYDYFFRITDSIANSESANVLLTFDELLSEGFDGHHFVSGLAGHFRDLLVCQDAATLTLLEVSKNIRDRYADQAKRVPAGLLLKLLDICNKCDIDYRIARNQRLHVEIALLRMCAQSEGGIKINPLSVTTSPSAEKKTSESTQLKQPDPAPSVSKPVSVQPTPPDNKKEPEPIISEAREPESKPVKNPNAETTPPARGGSLLKGASLSAIRKEQPEQEMPAPVDNNLPADSFTDEQLQNTWKNFAIKLQQSGKKQLHATMTMNQPMIIGDNIVELIIHNQSQDNEIQAEKQDIVSYLRKELNNYKLILQTKIIEEAAKETAYTNKERYQKMVQKNPDLEEFRKQLGLELE